MMMLFPKKIKTISVLHNVKIYNRRKKMMKRKKKRVVIEKKVNKTKLMMENNQVMVDRSWSLQVRWLRDKIEMKMFMLMIMKIWMNLEKIHTDRVM